MSTIAIVGQAVVGQAIVGTGAAPHFFTPPSVVRSLPNPERDRLFMRMRLDVGLSVLKAGASYTTVENPTPEQIDAADVAYLGGHKYPVSTSEASDLTAAGYEVTST